MGEWATLSQWHTKTTWLELHVGCELTTRAGCATAMLLPCKAWGLSSSDRAQRRDGEGLSPKDTAQPPFTILQDASPHVHKMNTWARYLGRMRWKQHVIQEKENHWPRGKIQNLFLSCAPDSILWTFLALWIPCRCWCCSLSQLPFIFDLESSLIILDGPLNEFLPTEFHPPHPTAEKNCVTLPLFLYCSICLLVWHCVCLSLARFCEFLQGTKS